MNGHAPLSVSPATVAQALCLSGRRVAELVASGLLPKPVRPRNGFDLVATCAAYVSEKPNDLQAQRTRFMKSKADRAELDLKVRAHELVEVRAVERRAFAAGRQVRDGLLALPDRLAGIVSAEADQTKNHATLTREIRQALEALADPSTMQGGLSA